MKNKTICFFMMSALCFANCKQKSLELPREENALRNVLTEYGKQNIDNEVVLHTDEGDIILKLYEDTPLHRANFVYLAKQNYYTDGLFYRLVEGHLAQAGNKQELGRLQYELPMELSSNHFHKRGAIAMASDKPTKWSSATEFYLVSGRKYSPQAIAELREQGLKLTPEQEKIYLTEGGYHLLDGKYTVFGEVTKGIEIVDKIAQGKIFDTDKAVVKVKFKLQIKQ